MVAGGRHDSVYGKWFLALLRHSCWNDVKALEGTAPFMSTDPSFVGIT